MNKTAAVILPLIIIALSAFIFSAVTAEPVMAAERINETGAAAAASLSSAPPENKGIALKVMSYNIAAGQGVKNDSTDYVGVKYLDEAVKLINSENADLIGMQEVDDNRFTSRFVDQAKYIASRAGMHYYWKEASARGPFGKVNKHGNSVMSKYKILKKECVKYKSKGKKGDSGAATETRAFTFALVEINGVKINFISTHLGFPETARVGQAKELIDYVKKLNGPVIVTGDFNTTQGSESYKIITAVLKDSYTAADSKGEGATSPGRAPKNRIDFIFFSKNDFTCEKAYAGGDNYKTASDHRPFFAMLKLKGPAAAGALNNKAPQESGTGSASDGAKILELQKSLFDAK
jgi:endonuclease/exonuclease/phosphatase family metal-dependent hydrolase